MNRGGTSGPGQDPLAFLAGGGEMGERTRAFDWSTGPLGPIAGWPQSLRSALSICLNSNFPIAIYWGPDLVLLYNDQWSPIPGSKHPWALGRPAREAWPEIWDIIHPLFERVLATGVATRSRDQLLPMHRHGFTEECYFDYTFSPIRGDDGRVQGVFNAVLETTTRVIGERRLRTLRELGAWKTGEARSAEEACRTAAHVLADNPHDLPFALLYLLDADGRRATLAGQTGLDPNTPVSPATVDPGGPDAPWPFRAAADAGRPVELGDLPARAGRLPGGAWPEPTRRAVVLPLSKAGQARPAGFLVAGVSPRLALDDEYRGFLDLLAGHVTAAVAAARAYAEERSRAEALAELDRAKTTFFSNVSHEFRTPLTLMLGPVEEALAEADGNLPTRHREHLEVARRNGLRLQRLVNTLLDFARIEAGRVRAVFEPTDLPAFTADLASNFGSACERAGLRLAVDCPPLPEAVFVDRAMWEKVVLNLLSNAFKFTLAGEIAVSVRAAGRAAELKVRDTGTGIPPEEMPRLFERFHRVENAGGRTHEGSGIGLALVEELVNLHGGSIAAESEVGAGTTFTVLVPFDSDHLPRDQVGAHGSAATVGTGAGPFVEEALRWLPDGPGDDARSGPPAEVEVDPGPVLAAGAGDGDRPRVLVADDNADMRRYVQRLLAGQYRVEAVADGVAALAAVRRRAPDLVVSDVMMPRLDGFGLLRQLRADPTTVAVPVVLLSARAGDESRAEGLRAGADDYLVKPFTARELLVRVAALLQVTRLRREADEAVRASEERLRALLTATSDVVYRMSPDWAEMRHLRGREFIPDTDEPSQTWFQKYIPPADRPRVRAAIEAAIRSKGVFELEHRVVRVDGTTGWTFSRAVPLLDAGGEIVEWFGAASDVTARKHAEERLRDSEERFRQLADAMPQIVWTAGPDGQIDYLNHRWTEYTGRPRAAGNAGWDGVVHPADAPPADERWAASLRTGEPFEMEARLRDRASGAYRWHLIRTVPVRDEAGRVARWFGTGTDIQGQKRAEESSRYLAEASAALARVADSESTLQRVANLAVPYFADWAAVDVADDDGPVRRLAVAHQDPAKVRLAHELMRDYPPDPMSPTGLPAVFRTGRPEIVGEITDEMLARGARDDRHLGLLRSLGPKSYLCVPLVVAGKPLAVLTFVTAESGRTYTEADLALATDLAHRAAVAVENTRLYQALREADRRKDEFLATLAHELRNPLAPIRNSLEILKTPGVDPGTAGRSRDMMERQVHHLVRLVDDLLDVSRVMRGKIELRRERVELATVVARAVESAQPLMEAHRHQLRVSLPPEPVALDADPVRLAQVVGNLLTNAAKYTEPGGRVDVIAERAGDTAVLRIRDTGIGIAPSMLPRIFELFVQADQAASRAQGGLGIGLTLVRSLVEMHGGTVEAHSDGPGRGSELVVRLPTAAPHPSRDGSREGQARGRRPPPAPGHRLLVVDDNRDAADSLATWLRLQGHQVRVAYGGRDALELAQADPPEAVFLDLGMPGMDGYEVARRLRHQPGLGRVVLAALTGWGQPEDRRRTAEAGFDHHFTKPVEPDALHGLFDDLKRRKP